jgi:hypothetical protein
MSDVAYPRWSTVKSVLDDPGVSGGDKQRLLADYARQAAYDRPYAGMVNQDYVDHHADIDRYAKQYGATDTFRSVQSMGGLFANQQDALRKFQQANQQTYQDQLARAHDSQQAGQARNQLAALANQTVARGGAGARTSDDLLKPGSRGLSYFQYFGPAYRDWTGSGPDQQHDIVDVYQNLHGIQLAHFRADAAQLSTSHGKLSDSALALSSATNSLGGFWQGSAAQAAQRYCGSFVHDARTATDGTSAASKVITSSMKAIETAVLQRAQGVLPLFATDVGGVPPEGVRSLIDIARNKASDDDLRAVASWQMFTNVDWGDTDCHGNLSKNVKNLAAGDAANWLNNTFVPNFDQKKQSFDSVTKSTHDTVGQSFDAMNQALGKINADPFGDLSKGIQVGGSGAGTAIGGGSGAGTAVGGGSGGGGSTGGSGGGGGTVSGGGAPAGGGPGGTVSTPPLTPAAAPTPAPAAAATTPDSFTAPPGDSPVTQGAVTDGAAQSASYPVDPSQPGGFTAPIPSTSDPTTLAAATSAGSPDAGLGGGVATGGAIGGALGFGGGGGGDVAGAVLDGGQAAANIPAAHHAAHDAFGGGVPPVQSGAGLAGTNVTPIGQPGGAGLASAPDGALNQGDQGGGGGGMPMMGMGGMGAGQGGDQQRGGNHQWRTFGHLFDDATGDDTIGRFTGTLDDGR